MPSNLDRYKKDLDRLIDKGLDLSLAMQRECFPEETKKSLERIHGEKTAGILKALPNFRAEYQTWYSEAKALIKQLLPDRLADLVRHYEKPKSRKEFNSETYRIEDFLLGLSATRGQGINQEKIAVPGAAFPHFMQQLAILESVRARFDSSLFDIRLLVQADLFDSELDAAKELVNNKFTRAAGALAGVVLERHLGQVCDNHGTKIAKKTPTISDLNDALKNADVIDIPQWRFVQHLGDIRNLCDHCKTQEPTSEQVNDLIDGVLKITKTMF
jgi:hypothetical protein